MVCSSSLVDVSSGTGNLAWLDPRGPPEWLSKGSFSGSSGRVGHTEADHATASPEPTRGAVQARAGLASAKAPHMQGPPTQATKELLRLRKKLREIAKIEEHVETGVQIDVLQRQKLLSKKEVASQLAQAMSLAPGEKTFAVEDSKHFQQTVSWKHDGEQMRMSPIMAEEEVIAPHLGTTQASCPWPAYGPQPRVRPLRQLAACTPLPPNLWAEDPAEPGALLDAAGANTGTRQHRRQKRAARHGPKGVASAPPDARGNKLSCTGLAEGLDAGGERRAAALTQLQGSVVRLAFDPDGCRTVQLAIKVAEQGTVAKLVQELRGHVREAVKSPHANYVLQAVIVSLPTAMSGFVVRELLGAGTQAARHRFGCRILCRLIEHSGASEDLAVLLQELLAEAEELCRHPFAHFVLQSVLEHLPEHRPRVARSLHGDPLRNACHRCASRVMESAFELCAEQDRQGLAFELTRCRENVVAMAQNNFGQFVLRAVLELPGEAAAAAWGHLGQELPFLERTKHGQRLMRYLGVTAVLAA